MATGPIDLTFNDVSNLKSAAFLDFSGILSWIIPIAHMLEDPLLLLFNSNDHISFHPNHLESELGGFIRLDGVVKIEM